MIIGSATISVSGVIDQGDEISQQLTAGVTALQDWVDDLDIDLGLPGERVDELGQTSIDWITEYVPVFASAAREPLIDDGR